MESIISSEVLVYINLFGKQIPFITDAVVIMWIIMAVIMVGTLVLTRKMETVPKGGQKLVEVVVEFINNMCKNQIGHHWRSFAPYMGTVLIFLVFSNISAIFNIIPSGSFLAWLFQNPALESFHFSIHPPTKNINVTACLALMSIILVIWAQFRFIGVKGWIRSFYKPTPISGFIKILDVITRPLSLCLRLFGNIMGGAIVMTLIYNAMPIIAPAAAGIYFDLFDGILQAYVFVFLTMIYVSEAIEIE